jgi:hypothetical protein
MVNRNGKTIFARCKEKKQNRSLQHRNRAPEQFVSRCFVTLLRNAFHKITTQKIPPNSAGSNPSE